MTASWDETARIWDADSGAQLAILRGHRGFVKSAAFSPDGERVVTASDDGTARIWDAESGAQLEILRGHHTMLEPRFSSAAFSPDGERVVTASDGRDGADLGRRERRAARRSCAGTQSWVDGAAFSPDGERVVTASEDRTARIWDAESTAAAR